MFKIRWFVSLVNGSTKKNCQPSRSGNVHAPNQQSRNNLQTSQQKIIPTGWLHGLVMTPDCRIALDEKNIASQKQILYDLFSVQTVSIVFYVLTISIGLIITSMNSPQHKYRQASTSRRWPSARPYRCGFGFNPQGIPKVRCGSYILRWLLSVVVVEKLSLAPRAKITTSIEPFFYNTVPLVFQYPRAWE